MIKYINKNKILRTIPHFLKKLIRIIIKIKQSESPRIKVAIKVSITDIYF